MNERRIWSFVSGMIAPDKSQVGSLKYENVKRDRLRIKKCAADFSLKIKRKDDAIMNNSMISYELCRNL